MLPARLPPPPRRLWLDWQRGVAVLLMVEVHVLDAWLAPGVQRGRVHQVLQLLGGLAAPSFLYMAGLSVVLASGALERKGLPVRERTTRLLRRAGWLLGVALLFRAGEYVLGGMWRVPGGWHDLLRVDILNVIAIALAVTTLTAVAAPRALRLPLTAGLACAVALVTPPLVGALPPGPLVDYLLPRVPGSFALFNWSAFALGGAALGLVLASRDRPALTLVLGAALVAAGFAMDRAPPLYAHQDFWHDSPAWFAIRLGVVVAIGGALQLVPASAARALSPLSLLGRHSLLGYMASVELTYGLSTKPLHQALGTPGVLVGIAVAVLFTLALAAAAERVYEPWVKTRRSARAASS